MATPRDHIRQSAGQATFLYKFTLQEDTEFQGSFNQASIVIKPAYFNGTPIALDVGKIFKILRVNNPAWKISQKLKYFIFELIDGTKIAGLPSSATLLINLPLLKECKVFYENILSIEKVT